MTARVWRGDFCSAERAREPVNWRAAVAAPRRSQACAAGLASPLPALRLRHGTRAGGESTPTRHSKSTHKAFTVRVKSSNKQPSVPRASSAPSDQRCHQRCAVAGETLKRRAAALIEQPPSIAWTSAKRAASPSLALACRYIRALLRGRGLRRPTASKEGRIEPSAVHNLCRRDS